jgi:hypothetical protein
LIKRFTDLIFQGVTPTHGCSEKVTINDVALAAGFPSAPFLWY